MQAVKLLAKLDIGASALPLDGKGSYKAGATTFNLRISTMPTLHGDTAGDLIAEVDIRLPVHLTEEQRKAAESFPQI